jgi:hypothetical protein
MRFPEKLQPLALLLLRCGLAMVFVYHRYPKLFGKTATFVTAFEGPAGADLSFQVCASQSPKTCLSPGPTQGYTDRNAHLSPSFFELGQLQPIATSRTAVFPFSPTRAAAVASWKKYLEKLGYMHNNPVKRGLVASPGDWPWSNWRFYYLNDGSVLEMHRVGLTQGGRKGAR